MDVQDHKKTSPAGHEGHGVHVCPKCAWPFPNPHPSAKHRRAHKKVCGKVEGYKIIDSEQERLSDDEHSDDDMRTPSPKMEKGIAKELGSSGGIGLKSSKSEDEVFSDAVTEFSDSGVSPSVEERLESVGRLDKKVGEELVYDLIDNQQTKDSGTDGRIEVLHDPTSGTEISSPDAVGNAMNLSENTKSGNDIGVQVVSLGVDQTDELQINSSPVENISKSIDTNGDSGKEKELIASGLERDVEVKESGLEVETPELESKFEDLKEKGSGHVVLDCVVPEADGETKDTVILEPKLHEADTEISHTAKGSEIVEQEKELSSKLLAETGNVIPEPILCETDGNNLSAVGEIEQVKRSNDVLQADVIKHDLSSQIEPPKGTDGSVTTQVEDDSAKEMIEHDHNHLAEVDELKGEGDNEMHLVSVSELPAIENPEILTEDFKDYRVLKSSFPLDLGDAEVTSPTEGDKKVTLSEADPSSISSIPVGSLTSSHSDVNSSDNHEKGVLAPIGGEVDASGFRTNGLETENTSRNSFPLDLGDAEVTSPMEGDKKVTLSEADPSSISSIPVGSLTSSHSDVNSSDNHEKGVLAPIGGEVDASGFRTNGLETENTSRNCSPEEFQPNSTDETSSQNVVSAPSTMVLSDAIPAVSSIDEETTNSSKVEIADDIVTSKSDYVKTESGLSHSFNEVKTPSLQKCIDEVNVDAAQGLEIGKPEDHSVASNNQSENLNDTRAQKSISALGDVSELNSEDQNVVSDKNSENSVSEEPPALPVSSAISNRSSAAFGDANIRDASASEPLLDQGDGKREHLNVSAVDNSVVSSSRTESLDGNWGSVSVLSTQSDGTALSDAEALPSGTPAPEKSGGTPHNPETATQGHNPYKSDDFEPPSFMTLVESESKLDKTVAATEIQNAQKTELPKSEALQAGWFPSLTNVVNESEGRKKNEEIIAKVTNRSPVKQHSPLKNLLNEAHAETKLTEKQVPSVNQADETAAKNNGAAVATVSSIMGSETPVHDAAKREMEKEWNSPARYPTEIKKEKKKGKPYWVPFVCCTSVHQDM